LKNNKGDEQVTIIGTGVVIEGKLSSKGDVRIDGSVKGDVKADGNVTVGESGEVDGQLFADIITLGGKVMGSVNAKEKLVLEAKAALKGDIVTKILVVEAGAKFDGKSSMGDSKEPLTKPVQTSGPPQNIK
jgi:cytoskeletal protein CcmA (bactofilin family)